MANALRVNVGEGSEELIDVELDFQDGHRRFHLVEETRRAIHGFGDEFLDEIEVDLVFLCRVSELFPSRRFKCSYAFAVRVVEGFQLDNVRVTDDAHDLQFTVLLELLARARHRRARIANLESLVLENTLDGGVFS